MRGGVAVKNLRMNVCETDEDALNELFEGEINRTYAAHELNSHSSRSHAVFTLYIESRSRVESTEKVVYSKLHLVDLAGSERTKKTGTHGTQLTEARHINKSLTFLEQVVLALSDRNREHIPYR
jgi:kinesin family member 6/9